jgi:hypothetical protein
LDVPAIDAAMIDESTVRDRTLEHCDIRFYEQQDLGEPLFAYIKQHQGGIRI